MNLFPTAATNGRSTYRREPTVKTLIALAFVGAFAIAAVGVTTYTGNTAKGYVQWTVGGVVLGQEWP